MGKSKSQIKRETVQRGGTIEDAYEEINRELKKGKEKPAKNPKVPTFPPAPAATAQKLREIIDGGGPLAPLAYGALSRLCVLWTPGAIATDTSGLGGGQMGIIVNELIGLFHVLFPNGEGLPEEVTR